MAHIALPIHQVVRRIQRYSAFGGVPADRARSADVGIGIPSDYLVADDLPGHRTRGVNRHDPGLLADKEMTISRNEAVQDQPDTNTGQVDGEDALLKADL